MDELARQSVLNNVSFTFDSDGKLKLQGKMNALAEFKKAASAEDYSSPLTEIERAIVELTGIGFTEMLAGLAFSAGARATRDKALAAGQDVPKDLPKQPYVEAAGSKQKRDRTKVDPEVFAAQMGYEAKRSERDAEAERMKAAYNIHPDPNPRGGGDKFERMARQQLIDIATAVGVIDPYQRTDRELRDALRKAYQQAQQQEKRQDQFDRLDRPNLEAIARGCGFSNHQIAGYSDHQLRGLARDAFRQARASGKPQDWLVKDTIDGEVKVDPEPTRVDLPALPSGSLTDNVMKLLKAGKKIEAIKTYREKTGADLRTAKDAVEAIAETMSVRPAVMPSGEPEPDVSGKSPWWRSMSRESLHRLAVQLGVVDDIEEAEEMSRIELIREIRQTGYKG